MTKITSVTRNRRITSQTLNAIFRIYFNISFIVYKVNEYNDQDSFANSKSKNS